MAVVVLLFLFVMLLPISVWLITVPEPWTYLHPDVPSGQLLYVLSKLAGLVAMASLTFQLAFVMLKNRVKHVVPLAQASVLHYRLGITTLLLVISHVVLFVLAASSRTGAFKFDLLLPNWNGFYNTMVSLGVFAFYLALLVVILGSAIRLKRLKNLVLHRGVALLCVVLVFVHSIAIGSETDQVIVRGFYLVLGVAVVGSVIGRFRSGRNRY